MKCRTILTKPVTCPISARKKGRTIFAVLLYQHHSLACVFKAPCVCVLCSDPVRIISRLMVPVKRQHLEEGSPPFGLGSCDQKVGGLRLGYALLYFGIGVGALYLKSTNVPLGARGRWAPKSKPAKVTHRPSWPTKAAKPGHFAFPRDRRPFCKKVSAPRGGPSC